MEQYKSSCKEAADIEVVVPKATSSTVSGTATPTGTSRVTQTADADEDEEPASAGQDKGTGEFLFWVFDWG